MKKKEVIRLEEVWRTYHVGSVDVHALRGVSLSIHQGEFVALLGPSGSGKSTLMNMVGALDTPSKGAVYLSNKDISLMPESQLSQIRGRTIGFVFQQFNLIRTLTALQNVMLPMIFQQTSREKREARAKKLLSMVGLGDRMTHKPTELSGGQQQRVAIARALANDPDMLLADEPTGNLDTSTGKDIMTLLNTLNKEGKTIVLVTHDTGLVRHAKRVIYIKDGRVDKTYGKKKR